MRRSAAEHPRIAAAALLLALAPATTCPLAGSYRTNVSGTGWTLVDADWSLRVGADGRYALSRDGSVVARGRAVVEGRGVVFTDTSGRLACRGGKRSGSYTWRFTRASGLPYLVLKVVRDRCLVRRTVLSQPLLRG